MTNEVKNVPKLRFQRFEDEWKKKRLKDIVEPLKGNSGENKNLPVLTISAKKGWLNQKERFSQVIAGNSLSKYNELKKGDLSYNKGNSKVALYGIVYKLGFDNALVPNVYKSFRPKPNNVSDFLEKYFHTKILDRQLRRVITSTARMDGLLNISDHDFYNMSLNIPVNNEQKKIGDFFSKLDRQIELEEQKLEKLEEEKKGYMQKLFSQEIRFKDNKGNNYPDWKIVEIGDILEERTERSGEGDMLSVTINNGIIKFDEIDRKDNSSKDKSNYRKVYKDDITYNSMRMWQGASGKSEYEGIVSPAYTVTIPSENINPDFIAYYFKTHKMIHKFKINSQGLTSDTWNLKYRQLKDIKLNLCSKEEQNKIANLLIMYDKLINKQKHKLEILKTNKKGFLQKMFV